MNTEWAIFVVFLVGILGGAMSGLIGWGTSGEPFNGRSFAMTVLRSVFGSALATGGFAYNPDVPFMYALLTALSASATADVVGHRIAGAVVAKRAPPKPPTP